MTNRAKIILIVCLMLIILGGLLWYFYHNFKETTDEDNLNFNQKDRLEDSDLLYASRSSSGLCLNEEGKKGGCFTNYYLYTTGKFIKETGFIGFNGQKTNTPSEKQLSQTIVSKIKETLVNSGIMDEDCSTQQIVDASFKYQINLNGIKKSFNNPPYDNCRSVFNSIDQLLNSNIDNETRSDSTAEVRNITIGTVGRFSQIDVGVNNVDNNTAVISIRQKNSQESIQKTIKLGEKIEVYGFILEALEIKKASILSFMPGSNNGFVKLRITQVNKNE